MSHEKAEPNEQDQPSPLHDTYSYRDLEQELPELEARAPVLLREELDDYIDLESRNRTVEVIGANNLPSRVLAGVDTTGYDVIQLNKADISLFNLAKQMFLKRDLAHRNYNGTMNYLTDTEINKLLENGSFHAKVQDKIEASVENDKKAVKDSAWWVAMDDEKYYEKNPFEEEATEQITFGHGSHEISLYNFGEELNDWEVRDIQVALRDLDIMTNGLIFKVLRNIVVTNDLAERYFEIEDATEKPDGLAHSGKGFMSLNRKGVKERSAQHNEAGTKSTLMKLVYHEAAHLIDDYIKLHVRDWSEHISASFEHYFDYRVVEDDPKQEVTPKNDAKRLTKTGDRESMDIASLIREGTIIDSKPAREYGYTNSQEDFATAMEDFMIGREVDFVRREAIFDILRYAAAEGNVYTEGREDIRRRMAEEIYQPTRPLMAEPITYVEDKSGTRVESAFPEMEIQRNTGGDIRYPKLDTSRLHRSTKAIIQVNLQY